MKQGSRHISKGKQKFTSSALAAVLGASMLMAGAAQVSASVTAPVIGKLLWSEEFNGTSLNTSRWNVVSGNGCESGNCGFGNGELEYYSPGNVSIVNVPFESATRALAIKAQRQSLNGSSFTSGKITSSGKVKIQYGMIEIRVSTPKVGTGLWPAIWMLGTGPGVWPRNGEIDIMEMGHGTEERALAKYPAIDNYSGSNVVTYQAGACVPGNLTCAASSAWQTKNWYIASTPLANRFVKYRLYWTDSQIRFTVIDNGVERNMYDNPLPVNSTNLAALQTPFYLLFNMAVGGNLTDATTPAQVTATLPGTMYVDYVRVYQLDGKGAVTLGK